jgi:hypothetical protein
MIDDKEMEDEKDDTPFSGEAALAMGVPGDGTVRRIWA